MTPDVLSRERPYLMGLAYRMLGSAAEAEDVVQEALARASRMEDARTPRALLTTIVTRLCLDELRSARRRRESYVGPWLPEPVLTDHPDDRHFAAAPDARIDAAESVSIAFLLLLESLTPHERAVFILREVLELQFEEIARAVGRSEVACRQLLHRARGHVAAGRRRFPAADAQRELASRFLSTLASGDTAGLVELLVNEASLVTDHGGKAKAARRTVMGAERVARMLLGLHRKGAALAAEVQLAWVNGSPALLAFRHGTLESVLVLDATLARESGVDSPRVAGLHVYRNPDKLGRALPVIPLRPSCA